MTKSNFIFTFIICLFFNFNSFSQTVLTGGNADQKIKGTQTLYYSNSNQIPTYIKFQKAKALNKDATISWFKNEFDLNSINFDFENETKDQLGQIHYKYKLNVNGITIENTTVTLHSKNNKIISISGNLNKESINTMIPSISEADALANALNYVNANIYKWEVAVEESHIKTESNNTLATYFPKGKKVILPSFYHRKEQSVLAYKFDIYAHTPVSRSYIYIDANTGSVLFEDKIIKHIDAIGSATTAYSGVRTITTDDNNGTYRLRETGRGNGIETYDMGQGTNFGNAVDFTDADNNWNNANSNLDEYAGDAHWGAEMTYDYFWLEHGRNSIDNNGFLLRSYIHYNNSFVNAFWDGQRMTYGDGDASNTPLTTIDICGHEISHGLTSNTAGLIYNAESGALNESFSDIFGACIENYGRPLNWNWSIGEDIGGAFRDMSNPNNNGDPDTYMGTNWAPLSGPDNGGVHTNSGVQNYWFYLLTTGGNGTNDNGDSYTVSNQGFAIASSIAFRNLTLYLTANSNYADARFLAIQSAIDLYGNCSPEVIATTNAWHAVGVGLAYSAPTTIADFMSIDTLSCTIPFTVSFMNNGNGDFYWNFGDGSAIDSTFSPTHTFNSFGNFSVQLIADGGACSNIDTLLLNNYIVIEPVGLPAPVNDTICENNTATLISSNIGSNNWYDSPTGGNILHYGADFTTPLLSSNTDYYVSKYVAGPSSLLGPIGTNIGTGGYYSGNKYIRFNCLSPMVLRTVDAYAGSAGDRTIELRDDLGNVLATKTVYLYDGLNTIQLNFELTVGNDFQLGTASGLTDLFRNNSGVGYPYSNNDLTVIITSGNGGPYNYYHFYNWVVEIPGCESERLLQSVITNPDFDLYIEGNESTCENETAILYTSNLTGGSWSSDCINCIDANTGEFNPNNAGVGNWVISYTYYNSCEKTVNFNIEVKSCLGIINISNETLNIYPNPTNNHITIVTENQIGNQIYFYDLRGKLLISKTIDKNVQEIELTNLKQGIYLALIKDDSGNTLAVKKITKL